MPKTILSLHNLSIYLGHQALVEDLSYDLFAGETLAIVGESGSGKSISSLALLGLLPSNLTIQGQLAIAECISKAHDANIGDSEKFPLKALPLATIPQATARQVKQRDQQFKNVRGRRIGMIFQEPMTALNPLHSVGKQIEESLMLAGKTQALTKDEIKHKIICLLEDVNIIDPVSKLSRLPHELSGGQRQRVMIAMALAQDPDILIADEPTTALDVTLQHDILALLARLRADRGLSMLLISHDLNLVRRYSDAIIVMRAGKVIEKGVTSDIFNNPSADYTRQLMAHDFGQAHSPETIQKAQQSNNYRGLNNTDSQGSNTSSAQNNPILEVKDLSVEFPLQKRLFGSVATWYNAVKPLNIKLAQGYAIGIVGESGSGKTTIALAISRLLSHHAKVTGEIVINGQDINSLSKKTFNKMAKAFRSDVQVVFQDPFASINPRFNVLQIVEEGLKVQGIEKSKRRQAVIQALETVNLPADFIERYPHELSGGQRQRVALARALVMRPKLIILDEPTSALDSTTQVTVVELLRQIQLEYGISYVFISHDLRVVRALCQHIMVLKNGNCVESAPTEVLFNNPQHEYSKRLIKASLETDHSGNL